MVVSMGDSEAATVTDLHAAWTMAFSRLQMQPPSPVLLSIHSFLESPRLSAIRVESHSSD